ncbi:MAG: hypothetical protein V1903_08970 [Bacteroidota bacterium]
MKRNAFLMNFLVLLAAFSLAAKGQQPTTEDVLNNLFTRILGTRDDDERMRLNDSLVLVIDKYAGSGDILTHRFENLRYLGQILSPDSRIKILTWNLILTDGTNKYFCYIIRRGGKDAGNKITKLTGINMDDAPRTDVTYTEDNWYGALYYGIQPFRAGKKTCYAVLGLDFANLQVSRKIIDVISFGGDGRLTMGRGCFRKEDQIILREVFEYQVDGVMTLRFNDKKTIIFDNLAPISTGQKYDQGYYGTEFSFNAYVLKKGFWDFVKNYDVKIKQ